VETHIQGLSSLGKSEHSYGDLLIPVVMEKVPVEVQRNLAREHLNSTWNLPDLMAAILEEIRILETGPHDLHNSMLKSMVAAFHVASSGNWSRNKVTQTLRSNNVCFVRKIIHPTTVML